MCKEDIRIKRKAAPGEVFRQAGTGNMDQVALPANANRVAIVAAFQYNGAASATYTLATIANGIKVGLIHTTQEHPYAVLTIEEYGQAILGPIYVQTGSIANTGFITVFELVLLEPLEDV